MAKSELVLAFNEIAETRKLPRDVIVEALKAALVSAYRRNAGISSAQHVEARVDESTGEPSIWVEKEVVEGVESPQTEVDISEALLVDSAAELGETILVDDTPADFGRIAAQTAKQVFLQRMREAEREAQYQEYMDRVGDLITGTVQSDTGDVVTIGLGRTEAILPRSQQQPGERYRMHDKVRAYVMEVRRTNRGPQIVVSRTHRGMLRRLLEYEVPEIYNGTVEIKSIAREPGARSKVAVAALQPGADPVGACVGMRGVRIQSIVKELNNEKIDVIEWSPDQSVFISKALSPARVNSVFLDDDPESGRTATVVVPDDQLSLAIGRAGQNARLAAKLTGWRIDIKSVTEAAQEAFKHIQEEEELADLREENLDQIEKIGQILEKKAENRPVMPEEYSQLTRFVDIVESRRAEIREELRSEVRAQIAVAKEQVPEAAYQYPLEDTDLPLRVYNLLDEAGYQTVGEVMEQYYYNPDRFLDISGFGPAALEDIEAMIKTIEFAEPEVEEPVAAEAEAVAEGEVVAEVEAEAEVEPVTAEAEAVLEPAAEIPEDKVIDEEAYERARRAALVAGLSGPQTAEAEVEEPEEEQPVEVPVAEAPAVEVEAPEEEAVEAEPEEEQGEPAPGAPYVPEPDLEDLYDEDIDEETARERARQRRRQLVYDEEAGRLISKRRRKGSRKREKWMEQWEEYEDE
jgi:N utilization substance protein A